MIRNLHQAVFFCCTVYCCFLFQFTMVCCWCIKWNWKLTIQQQRQHHRCEKPSVWNMYVCVSVFFFSLYLHHFLFMMPSISHISRSFFHKSFIIFFHRVYEESLFLQKNFYTLLHRTLYSSLRLLFFHSLLFFCYAFIRSLFTMINKTNLFQLYLHCCCTCDAIMTSKVKLNIMILFSLLFLFFFILFLVFLPVLQKHIHCCCFYSKVLWCAALDSQFVYYLKHYSSCYICRYLPLRSLL